MAFIPPHTPPGSPPASATSYESTDDGNIQTLFGASHTYYLIQAGQGHLYPRLIDWRGYEYDNRVANHIWTFWPHDINDQLWRCLQQECRAVLVFHNGEFHEVKNFGHNHEPKPYETDVLLKNAWPKAEPVGNTIAGHWWVNADVTCEVCMNRERPKRGPSRFYCFDCNDQICENCIEGHNREKGLDSCRVEMIEHCVSCKLRDEIRKAEGKCEVCGWLCQECIDTIYHEDHDAMVKKKPPYCNRCAANLFFDVPGVVQCQWCTRDGCTYNLCMDCLDAHNAHHEHKGAQTAL